MAGGSVAALVCAWAGARAGREVELLLPEQGVGGGFAGLVREGRRLPLGARLLELGHEAEPAEPPPLTAYDPGFAGHVPHLARIRAVVESLAGDGLIEVEPPRTVRGGRWAEDLYWAASLDGLPALLLPAERAAVAREAAAACAAEGDAGLLAADRTDELDAVSVTEASTRQHGPSLHQALVEPMARKVWAGGGDDVPAALRRKVWLALFWPRTVAQAAGGEQVGFRPRRPFSTVSPGGIESLLDALMDALEQAPKVAIRRTGTLTALERRPGGVRLAFADGAQADAAHAVLGVSPGDAFGAVGAEYAPTRLRSVLAWLEVGEDALKRAAPLVHFADADVPAFRASPYTAGVPAGRIGLCVELRHDQPDPTVIEAARESLERAGMLSSGAEIVPISQVSAPVLVAPTFGNRQSFVDARERFAAHDLPVRLVGGAADFGADSFNEQVVQGLQAAEAA